MNLPDITGLIKVGKAFAQSNRPELLLGASITGTIGGSILAAVGGYKARGRVEEAQNPSVDLNDPENPLTFKDKAQLTWDCYIPAVAGTVGALGSTAGLHFVHVKEKKALTQAGIAAVAELKESFKEYEQKNIGQVSEEERTKILEDRLEETGVGHIRDFDDAITEMYIVRDARTGRDIWSNQTLIEDAVNTVNDVLNKQGDCELNTFYGAAGFNLISPDGDDYGWSGELVRLTWDLTVRDDGRPVRQFTFQRPPRRGYLDFAG